jgi:hypothetical protein
MKVQMRCFNRVLRIAHFKQITRFSCDYSDSVTSTEVEL